MCTVTCSPVSDRRTCDLTQVQSPGEGEPGQGGTARDNITFTLSYITHNEPDGRPQNVDKLDRYSPGVADIILPRDQLVNIRKRKVYHGEHSTE